MSSFRTKLEQAQKNTDHMKKQLSETKAEINTLTEESEDQKKDMESLQKSKDELESSQTSLRAEIEDQKAQITLLQKSKCELESSRNSLYARMDTLRTEKEKIYNRLNNATLTHATVTNTLTRTQNALKALESENKTLEQRCYKTGQERDAANASVKKLEAQVKKHEANADQLGHTINELEDKLREDSRLADAAREFAAMHGGLLKSLKKDVPQASDKSSDEDVAKLQDREMQEAPVALSESPMHTAGSAQCSTFQPSGGHATPPPDYNTATCNAITNQDSNDGSSIAIAPAAHAKTCYAGKEPSTEATKKISFSLANQTPPKAKTAKVKSPLARPGPESTQDDLPSHEHSSTRSKPASSNDTSRNHKRKRNTEEQTQDPRLAKRTPTAPRSFSGESSGAHGRYQSFRPSYPPGPRSPETNPYARRW